MDLLLNSHISVEIKLPNFSMVYHTTIRGLQEGNIFSRVCQSVSLNWPYRYLVELCREFFRLGSGDVRSHIGYCWFTQVGVGGPNVSTTRNVMRPPAPTLTCSNSPSWTLGEPLLLPTTSICSNLFTCGYLPSPTKPHWKLGS